MRDLRRAFYSLAQVGEQGQFIRQTALWAQMPESSHEVLDRFAKERLLTFGAEAISRTIRVTHDAIFRVWDTLHRWPLQDRKALTLRNQIEDLMRCSFHWHHRSYNAPTTIERCFE